VYEKYLRAVDALSESGGREVGVLGSYVSERQLKEENQGARYLKDGNLRIVGVTKLLRFKIQTADLQSGSISAYACVDFGGARVVNQKGEDVTPSGRVDKQTSLARFDWVGNGLVVDENAAWSGESIC
jgi:hypothetical protein